MRRKTHLKTLLTCGIALLPLLAATASASRVGDITRLDAQREETLTGLGLVFGLKGTGDGGDFAPAIRPLSQMLGKFSNAASVAELKDAKNVAVVALTVTVPANGVRGGDKLDVNVTSIGAAKTLAGGRLFVTPLTGPMPGMGVFALAEGGLVIEDPATPTVAKVEGGCRMEIDLPKQFVRDGRFVLVLDDAVASYTAASNIAKMINDSEGLDGQQWAVAVDPKNVSVTIPPAERARPDSFISRVQRLPVPLIAEEARVRINQRLGTVVITGDVEIEPVVISMRGLTISTVVPLDPAAPQATQNTGDPFGPGPAAAGLTVKTQEFVPLAPGATPAQRAKLQDLVAALDQLKVPADDRIAILKELHKTGKLHAKLIVE